MIKPGQVFTVQINKQIAYLLFYAVDEKQLWSDVVLVYDINPIDLNEEELGAEYVLYGYTMVKIGLKQGNWVLVGEIKHSMRKINPKKLVFKRFRSAEDVEMEDDRKNAKPEWIVWSIKNKKWKRLSFKKGEKLVAADDLIYSPANFVSKIEELKDIKNTVSKAETNVIEEVGFNTNQAVIIKFPISDEFGTELEQNMAFDLEDNLIEAIADLDQADVDGHEFGGGEVIIYVYGPSADAIFEKVQPVLKASTLKPIRVTRRYGEATDLTAKEKEDLIV